MKKTFIPQGTTEKHENIFTDELVVNGRLIVTGVIRAKKIYGNGMIEAQRINANTIVADTLDTDHICAKKVIANKIFCLTATVSVGIIAKDYIEAQNVKTSRLTATLSQIDKTEANEIIRLTPKRNFITAVFCSWLQERFAVWRHSRVVKINATTATGSDSTAKDPTDVEFENLVKDYRDKYRKGGYRLVLEAVEAEPKAV